MRLLGFYIGRHDSSIAYADLSGSVRYYKLERLIQSKHKRGSLDWIKELCREEGIVPDVICFSDGNRNSLGECPLGELAAVSTALADWQDVPCFCIDHHYAHILSAWPVMNDGDTHFVKRGICVDGRGDHQIKCSVIEHPFDLGRARIIHADENADFCLAFNKIGAILRLQGGELDFAGKIMGMYAYGKINEAFMKQYAASMHNGAVSDIVDIPFCGSRFDWVATMHASMEDYLDEIFSRFRFGSDPMVYAGGCAQNTVFNRRLLRGGR